MKEHKPKRTYQEREVDPQDALFGNDAELQRFVAELQPDERLFEFEESIVLGPRAARGRSGYFALSLSGEKRFHITSSWMS